MLSAALIPWTLWWMIFALEAGAAIHHHFFEPKEGFMVGLFIITFPVALVVNFTNAVGIIGMLKLMKVTARRG